MMQSNAVCVGIMWIVPQNLHDFVDSIQEDIVHICTVIIWRIRGHPYRFLSSLNVHFLSRKIFSLSTWLFSRFTAGHFSFDTLRSHGLFHTCVFVFIHWKVICWMQTNSFVQSPIWFLAFGDRGLLTPSPCLIRLSGPEQRQYRTMFNLCPSLPMDWQA